MSLLPSTDQIDAALRDLRYDRVWLESGVLSVDGLLRQHQDFLAGVERDVDHFHLHAFAAWSLMRVQLSDAEVDIAIRVATSDAGLNSAATLLKSLLNERLTDNQFERLLDAACGLGLGGRSAAYERFRRGWEQSRANEQFLRNGLASEVPAIHLFLARRCEFAWVLQELVIKGSGKEVRHTAKQRLRELERRQADKT
ncbi:MAG TPA: hypothetical protein VK157_11335 [Phycisphaerales bacterium]|nr:hypothetical protein [Phycisphaerales bacterium]